MNSIKLILISLILTSISVAQDTFGNKHPWAPINTPYTTLASVSNTGFTASRSGSSGLMGAWSCEIPMVEGRSMKVDYTLVLNSGQAPTIQISRTGPNFVTDNSPNGLSNFVTMVAGSNSCILTPTSSGVGRIIIYNTSATDFVVSNIVATWTGEDPTPMDYRFPRLTCGIGYNAAWSTAVVNGPASVLIVGDSNWSNPSTNLVSQYNNVGNIITRHLQTKFTRNITVTNKAIAGSFLRTWINGTAAADIAAHPKLIIIGNGVNDPANYRAYVMADLLDAISLIRSVLSPADCSIVVTGPSSVNDIPSGRDMEWCANINPAYRYVCSRNKCTFVDQFYLAPDSEGMKGIAWDTAGYAGGPVHRLDALNYSVISLLLEVISPRALEGIRCGPIDMSPVLSAPWANAGGGWETIHINRDLNGRVFVSGIINPTTSFSLPNLIINIPAGYRPVLNQQFMCSTDAGMAIINVDNVGNMTIATWPAGSTYLLVNFNFSSI